MSAEPRTDTGSGTSADPETSAGPEASAGPETSADPETSAGPETNAEPPGSAVGDDIVPDANMIFDRSREIPAPPDAIWPWLLQLGKRRAGWYLPRGAERLVPPSRRALRRLEPRFHSLAVGDSVPDYGGADAVLRVAAIDPPRALVYRDERSGTPFSWAITLEPLQGGRATRVHLRFRGKLKSSGVLRVAIRAGGGFFDGATGELMLRGLEERVVESPGAP